MPYATRPCAGAHKRYLPYVTNGRRNIGTGGKVPLILLPGIGGSQLVNDCGEQWPRMNELLNSPEDEFMLDLRLAPDGDSPFDPNDPTYSTTRVGGILRIERGEIKAMFGRNVVEDFYHTTIETLKADGYQENVNLFVFPFDWRKDILKAKAQLLAHIDRIRAQTGAPRVDILAHSMGGLVTLAALEDPASKDKVRKVMTLGTPVLGAGRALGFIQYQTPCFIFAAYTCFVNEATFQEALRNMLGAYQLLPSRAYDQAVGAPLYIAYDKDQDGRVDGDQPYEKWSAIVSRDRNGTLVFKDAQFHANHDTLTLADPLVQLVRVIGTNLPTVQKINEYETYDPSTGARKPAYGVINTPGDETVPQHAADLCNPQTGFDRRQGIPNKLFEDVAHSDLPKDGQVLEFVKDYFAGRAQPVPATGCEAPTVGVSPDLPGSVPPITTMLGIELETLGPVQGWVQDQVAHVLGRLPEQSGYTFSQEIPRSVYNRIADTQSFYIAQPGSYTGTLTITSDDPVRLRVRTYTDWKTDGQALFNVRAPVGAKLQITFASKQDFATLRLQLDREGDGVVDQELAPDSYVVGRAADDLHAPRTTALVTTVSPTEAEITLVAQDGPDGSGIAYTAYVLLSNPTVVHHYTGPFRVPVGTQVRFMSVDRVGNTERPQFTP